MNQLRTRLLRLQRLLEEDRQKERSDQMVHAVDSVAAEDELVSSTTYPINLAGPSCGILRHVCWNEKVRLIQSSIVPSSILLTARHYWLSPQETLRLRRHLLLCIRVQCAWNTINKIVSFSKTCSHISVKAVTSSVFCFQHLVLRNDSSFLADI